jgi:hypothetical protein
LHVRHFINNGVGPHRSSLFHTGRRLPFIFSAPFPAANSFIFGTRAGRNAPPPTHTHTERRFISQRDNDFILESISLSLNWVATASSRFCLDCAAPPVIYSGTISALSEKRIRESRARSSYFVHNSPQPADVIHTQRGMRLECAQRGECVSGVITSSLDGVNGARNAAPAAPPVRPPPAS